MLTEIIRRHEKTMKNSEGKKLDQPTPEGRQHAYQEGVKLRQEHPDHEITGYHSNTQRTYECASAWMEGAGREVNLKQTGMLNGMNLSKEEKDKLRNMSDVYEQYKLDFGEYKQKATEGGKRIAKHLVERLKQDDGTPKTEINITHGPVIDAAYLLLNGEAVSYENVINQTGILREGQGFDLEKDGDKVTIKLDDAANPLKPTGPREYQLNELIKRCDYAI